MRQLELHPLCTLFPRLDGSEFRALCDDIAANGLRESITTHDGMILDGGNRYRACLEVGVAPRFVKFAGPSVSAFVLSANLHRRHLSPGQQAAIVATVQDWAKAQPHGGDRRSDQAATLPLETVKSRAAQSGAGERTQRMADKVAREAPELAKQVAHGEISLPKAHEQISAPKLPPAPVADFPGPTVAAKPSKGAPTVESLQAENARLREELEEARQNARELADMLESYTECEEGIEAAAKALAKEKAIRRTVETQRDQWMTTCTELKRTVKSRDRQIAALERKVA
jgi:hypothetical protein